jgi:hypothetical protein
MKPSSISPRTIAILCAASLAIGIAVPAMTVTPPSKSTPTNKTPLPTKVIAPSKATPPSRTNSAPKAAPVPTANPINNPVYPATATTTNKIPLVAVPNLTPAILKNFTNVYGQVLELKFTPNQQQKIQNRISREWMTNMGLRTTALQTIAMEPQLANSTPEDRDRLQARLVGNLRQQVLDGDTDALWLVSFYDAASKNWLAQGQPPLTRMTTDMSADALCFMINEVMGKSVVTADSKLKNAIATKLTGEYVNIPANTKQELSRLPAAWLTFKDTDWVQRGDVFREQMRIHWGQNLEAYIPEIKEINKLRRDRLAKLKADPLVQWDRSNNIQRQAAFQKSELQFQTSVRALPPTKSVLLNNYVSTMQVGNAIGNSPTRYSLRLKIK